MAFGKKLTDDRYSVELKETVQERIGYLVNFDVMLTTNGDEIFSFKSKDVQADLAALSDTKYTVTFGQSTIFVK